MKIAIVRMVVVTVTAESDEDKRTASSIHRWLRDNKIVAERTSERSGSVNSYEALVSKDDADRLLSFIGRGNT